MAAAALLGFASGLPALVPLGAIGALLLAMVIVAVAGLDVETIGWVTQAAGFAGLAAGGTVLGVAAPRLGPRAALVGGRTFGFVIAPLALWLGWTRFFALTAIMMVPALIAFALVPRGRFAARAPSAGLLGSAP